MLFAFGLLFLLFLVMLIKPRWARMSNRKQRRLIYGSSILGVFIVLLMLAGPATEPEPVDPATESQPANIDGIRERHSSLTQTESFLRTAPTTLEMRPPSISSTPSVISDTELSPSPSQTPKISDILQDLATDSCDCPYDLDSKRRRCGERSAYIRSGYASPKCYTTD